MVERPMPQDVLKFKTKFALGLTVRQCVGVLLAVAFATFGFLVLFSFVEAIKIRIILTALFAIPPLVVCFVDIMGQPFEKVAIDMAIENFLAPAVRKKEYRHPELEKFEKDVTNSYLKKEKEDNEIESLDQKKGNKKKAAAAQSTSGKIKIKKSKEYPEIK